MKAIKPALLSLILILSVNSFSLNLEVNNKEISTEAYAERPLIVHNRTYVPLRFVSDALGFEVDWDASQNQVLIYKKDHSQADTAPQNTDKALRVILNGTPLSIPFDYGQPFINERNRTMVPVRAISEAMNFNVSFSNNTVYISNPVQSKPDEKEQFLSDKESSWNLSIMGEPVATREQLIAYTRQRANSFRISVPQIYNRPYLEVPEYLIDYFLDIGREYNIRGDIAYMQAIHETNFFQFTGIVQPYQNNYAGIAATGVALNGDEPHRGACTERIVFEPGVHGVTFSSPRVGVEAQIQHLYAYATDDPLPPGKELLNPRYELLKMLDRVGTAEKWVQLGGTWAVPGYDPRRYDTFEEAFEAGQTYGQIILDRYLLQALKF